MKPEDIRHVRSSFALVKPVAPTAAAMFYDRLFEREPGVKALFRGDMVVQGERLMAMIGGAVQLLEQPEVLQAALRELGRRHAGYGVRPQQYDAVGGALLDTLAAALGSAFVAEVRGAWAALYGDISTAMQAGAAAPRASAPPASDRGTAMTSILPGRAPALQRGRRGPLTGAAAAAAPGAAGAAGAAGAPGATAQVGSSLPMKALRL